MRKNNTKIIQIAGFRGLFMALFIGICLAAGFVVFPAKVAVYAWNCGYIRRSGAWKKTVEA